LNKHFLTAGILLIIISGCGIYSFSGSTLPTHIKSVAIPLFEDNSNSAEFGIDQQLADALIEAISRDNTLSIGSTRNANSILKGVITRITDQPDTYDKSENASAFRITISIKVVFEDIKKRKQMWEENFSQWGRYDNASVSRDDGIKAAVDKLANDILNRTVSGW